MLKRLFFVAFAVVGLTACGGKTEEKHIRQNGDVGTNVPSFSNRACMAVPWVDAALRIGVRFSASEEKFDPAIFYSVCNYQDDAKAIRFQFSVRDFLSAPELRNMMSAQIEGLKKDLTDEGKVAGSSNVEGTSLVRVDGVQNGATKVLVYYSQMQNRLLMFNVSGSLDVRSLEELEAGVLGLHQWLLEQN